MPYRYRSLQSPKGLSVMTIRVWAAIVGAVAAWAWLWFCVHQGGL